jgi:hypothetical protein
MMNFMFGLIFSLTINPAIQQNSSDVVYVQSWQRGERKIQPRKILIEMSKDHRIVGLWVLST